MRVGSDARIVETIKLMLGIETDYTPFDTEIMAYINGVCGTLYQLGVTEEPFLLTSVEQTWEDMLGDNLDILGFVYNYIYMKVKLLFDPPGSSYAVQAFKEGADEYEWRIRVAMDRKKTIEDDS